VTCHLKYSANTGGHVKVQPAGIAGQEDRLDANTMVCCRVMSLSQPMPVLFMGLVRGSGSQWQQELCAVDRHGHVTIVSLMLLSSAYGRQTAYSSSFQIKS